MAIFPWQHVTYCAVAMPTNRYRFQSSRFTYHCSHGQSHIIIIVIGMMAFGNILFRAEFKVHFLLSTWQPRELSHMVYFPGEISTEIPKHPPSLSGDKTGVPTQEFQAKASWQDIRTISDSNFFCKQKYLVQATGTVDTKHHRRHERACPRPNPLAPGQILRARRPNNTYPKL